MSEATAQLSKRLSWLLRHGAGKTNLAMDEAGWADISEVMRTLGITRAELDGAVRTNDKGRLVIDGRRVRCCQGHSLSDMPVTVEGLEASWEVVMPAESLWHGTRAELIEGIAERGILPGGRSHVHLAAHPDAKVGKRASIDLLIEVSSRRLGEVGLVVYRAPNGVLLARFVPVAAILGVRPVSAKGRKAALWPR